MDIAPRLNRNNKFSLPSLPFHYSDSLCEEKAGDGRSDQTSKAAANEEDGGETAGDVFLLGHPGKAGAKLPGDEESECGSSEVEAERAVTGGEAEEEGGAETHA